MKTCKKGREQQAKQGESVSKKVRKTQFSGSRGGNRVISPLCQWSLKPPLPVVFKPPCYQKQIHSLVVRLGISPPSWQGKRVKRMPENENPQKRKKTASKVRGISK